MTDKEWENIRKKISCPQFGDDHYGEWGILNINQRRTIKRMLDFIDGQENYIKSQQAEIEMLCEKIDEVIIAKDLLFDEAEALIKKARAEGIKEFAERLCEGRVSNDPVVIAVKCEFKEMVGEQG